jgi:hypothetical protein
MTVQQTLSGGCLADVGKAAGELVEVSVGSTEVDPLPAAVVSGGTDDLDTSVFELAAGTVDVIDLEQRHGTRRVGGEEGVVGVAW